MKIVKLIAMAIGLVIGAIGLVGVFAPPLLLEYEGLLFAPTAFYIVAGARVGFGIVLVWAAPGSRTPKVIRLLGILIIIAGVLSPFFGIESSRAVFDWGSNQGPLFTRVCSGVAAAFGLFIVYAVASPSRAAA